MILFDYYFENEMKTYQELKTNTGNHIQLKYDKQGRQIDRQITRQLEIARYLDRQIDR